VGYMSSESSGVDAEGVTSSPEGGGRLEIIPVCVQRSDGVDEPPGVDDAGESSSVSESLWSLTVMA